jgi:AraC-like DNA-binding protein
MRRTHTLLFCAILLSIIANICNAKVKPVTQLSYARDSLIYVLQKKISTQERLTVLMNLGDICLNLNNDYSYVEKLWTEALRVHDENAIIVAGRSLTLRWLNLGDMTKAEKWIKICEKEFRGKHRNPELNYLYLMRDIRIYQNQGKMAEELIRKQLKIKQNSDPYEKMCALYKLGTIALSEWSGNTTLKMKSWDEYMEEGYKVAKSLPFEESYSFRNQFLLALCYKSVAYNKEFLQILKDYRNLPGMKNRPFYSHRGDIIGCAHMFGWGDKLSRKEVDYWFRKFCELTQDYPYDCPTPYNFYFYSEAINYYIYVGDKSKILECCDSTIANASKYKMDDLWYYEMRGKTLAEMGRWREAYDNSKRWVAKKDSVANASSAAKLMELQTQYQVDHLKYEKKANLVLFISAAVLCIILMLGFWLLYRHYCILRRKNSALYEMLHHLQQSEEDVDLVKQRIPEEELSREEVLYRRMCELMHDEKIFTEQIGRKDLAERLGTNVTYIADAVRQCANGMKVSEFINLYRLRYASELLTNHSELSINAVGEEAGFSSRTTYYRLFGDYFGMSPNEFRSIARSKIISKKSAL